MRQGGLWGQRLPLPAPQARQPRTIPYLPLLPHPAAFPANPCHICLLADKLRYRLVTLLSRSDEEFARLSGRMPEEYQVFQASAPAAAPMLPAR